MNGVDLVSNTPWHCIVTSPTHRAHVVSENDDFFSSQASELKSGKLREVVENSKYLYLPRLSSRSLFNDLCPEERFRSQRRCLVNLLLGNSWLSWRPHIMGGGGGGTMERALPSIWSRFKLHMDWVLHVGCVCQFSSSLFSPLTRHWHLIWFVFFLINGSILLSQIPGRD